jgi:ribosome-associated protein
MNQEYLNEPEEFDDQEGEEIEIEAIGIEVSSHPIELYKLFKVANLVGGGGEAKHFIAEGYVAVNGELETRKRRKMYDGDFFEFNQEYYVVVCDQPPTEPEEAKVSDKPEPKAAQSKNSKLQKDKQKNKKTKTNKPGQSSEKTNKSNKTNSSKSKQKGSKDPNSGRGSIDFF